MERRDLKAKLALNKCERKASAAQGLLASQISIAQAEHSGGESSQKAVDRWRSALTKNKKALAAERADVIGDLRRAERWARRRELGVLADAARGPGPRRCGNGASRGVPFVVGTDDLFH